METISQIITNNINIISIDYPFDELKKDQERFFKNRKHEMNIRVENLKDVIKVFNEERSIYWLQGKTLLGMYRDHKLIENDHDDDIGTICENVNIVAKKIIPKLISLGFKVIRSTRNNSMVSVMRNWRYIDICFFKQKGGKKYGYEKKFFPKNFYESFQTITINNFDYIIPTKAKKIIQHSYNITI